MTSVMRTARATVRFSGRTYPKLAQIERELWNGLEAGGDVEIVFLGVKTGPHARLTGNQRRILEAIAWKRIAFDEYRLPATPPLLNALPPELADDEPLFLTGAQVAALQDPHVGIGEGIVPGAEDVPVPFVGEIG